jgi:hypothetical protein
MVLLNKKKIKEISHTIAPYLPYPIAQGMMELTNKGYINWLRDYVFDVKSDSSNSLRKKKCLFIHIPKCGGVSINNGLLKIQPGMGHLNAFDYLMALGKEEYNSLFRFTFVRNPWDRLVSGYFFMKQGGWKGRDQKWFNDKIGYYESFDDFVKNWVTPKNVRRHIIFTPQVEFIKIGNRIELDFIGRCEEMEKDVKYIADYIGVDAKPTKENTSVRPFYQDVYTAGSRDIVAQVYREDIKKLKYEF